MTHASIRLAFLAALALSGCLAKGPLPATDPPCLGASPCPAPSAQPTPAAPASPVPAGTLSTWDGVIRRNDQRQAGVTLRLYETLNSQGVPILQGTWTLRGDFNETAPLTGYRRGEVWTLNGTLLGNPLRFEATLANGRLQGPYTDVRPDQPQGTLDLLRR